MDSHLVVILTLILSGVCFSNSHTFESTSATKANNQFETESREQSSRGLHAVPTCSAPNRAYTFANGTLCYNVQVYAAPCTGSTGLVQFDFQIFSNISKLQFCVTYNSDQNCYSTSPVSLAVPMGSQNFKVELVGSNYDFVVFNPYNVNVTSNQNLSINVNQAQSHLLVCNSSDIEGSIFVYTQTGDPRVTYYLGSDSSSASSNQNFTALSPGTYTVNGKMDNCSAQVNVTIAATSALTTSLFYVSASCFTAEVAFIVNGGTPPYQIEVYEGSILIPPSNYSSVGPGSYTVVATDSNGCASSAGTYIDFFRLGTTVQSQYGKRAGQITITPTNGIPPYTYSLSGSGVDIKNLLQNSTVTFTDLLSGNYSYTATDSEGCQIQGNLSVAYEAPNCGVLVITDVETSAPQCFGGDGNITISAQGNGELSYAWILTKDIGKSPSSPVYQNSSSFFQLSSNNYTVFVQDELGCVISYNVTLFQPPELTLGYTLITDTCNGSITLKAKGGVSPYLYQFENGYQQQSVFNLTTGPYRDTVFAQDSNGCVASITLDVSFDSLFVVNAVPTWTGCNGTVFELNITGGTKPYIITENNISSQPTNNSLSTIMLPLGAGSVWRVQDKNGCVRSAQGVASVPIAGGVYATASILNETCNSPQLLNIEVVNGTAPFIYKFNGVLSNNSAYLPAAPDTLPDVVQWSVTDSRQCTFSGTSTLVASTNSQCGSVPLKPAPPRFDSQYYSASAANSIIVDWSDRNDSDSSIYYVLQVLVNNSWVTQYNGTNKLYTVANLQISTFYFFHLAVGNVNGMGEFSDTANYSTAGIPAAPILFVPQYWRSEILVQWKVTNEGGIQLSNFSIFFSNDSKTWTNVTIPANSSEYLLTGLVPSTTYYFRILVSNLFGTSTISSVLAQNTADPMCGDGICDPSETCAACYFDCCVTSPLSPCPSSCNNRGNCIEGQCVCETPWYGTMCENNGTLPITVVSNGTNIEISPPNTSFNIIFNLLIVSIQEIDENNNIITSIPLDMLANTSMAAETITLGDNFTYAQYSYSLTLSNSATLSIILAQFKEAHSITFADQEIDIPANGLKYSIVVENWPFNNLKNRVSIGIQPTARPSNNDKNRCQKTNFVNNDGNSLEWFTISVNGVKLYGQFEDYALLDNETRLVQFTYNQDQNIIFLTIPFFWTTAEIDPQFSVLVDADGSASCGKKKSTPTYIIVVAVVCPTVAVLVIGAILYYLRKRNSDHTEKQLIKFKNRAKNSQM